VAADPVLTEVRLLWTVVPRPGFLGRDTTVCDINQLVTRNVASLRPVAVVIGSSRSWYA
jgi:hypothetical protein